MRKPLLVLASLSAVMLSACASSSNNPWATPDSKPLPSANRQAAEPAYASTPSDALFIEENQPAPEAAVVPAGTVDDDLLAEFPAIRQTNLEKALRALKDASAVEELPMPDKGNARITRYNDQVGVIEFITPNKYAAGDRVVLTKENKVALVTVIAVDGDRIVADISAGVKGAPVLKASDYVLCDVYRTQEELEKIAAAQRKAQNDAIAAARAAAQASRSAAAEEDSGDDAAEDEGGDEEDSDDSEEDSEDEDFFEDEDF